MLISAYPKRRDPYIYLFYWVDSTRFARENKYNTGKS